MSNTAAGIAKRNELKNSILKFFQSNPGRQFDGVTICENLDISSPTKNKILRELREEYPEMKAKAGGRKRSGLYFWIGANNMNDLPAFENKEPENSSVNAEGYSDPTAGSAIDKVDRDIEKRANLPKFGEVMEARHATGDISPFVVLWSNDSIATGFYLAECEKSGLATPTQIFIKNTDKIYLANPTAVTSKPIKYLAEKMFVINDTTAVQIRHRICDILGVKPKIVEKEKVVEKPVEKVVYKDRIIYKEKPVEKVIYRDGQEVPEGYISRSDAVISDLLHQLDIYKDMVNRLAPLK